MRRSMAPPLWRFSTTRMLQEYTENLYLPAAGIERAGRGPPAGGDGGGLTVAPRISLALTLHNHQPVGNFGWVFAEVYDQAYRPMIEALERHPGVHASLHYTGPLLEWLIAERPDAVQRLRELVERDQVEILGGGYYEPVLASLPERDRIGQLTRMADELERQFGRRPRGAWLAERVWEPDLPTSLVASGYEWTILDDAHFRAAAIPEEDLWGPYTTEDQGSLLRVFGTEQGLRYRIPFRDVDEVITYLRDHATEDGARVGMMGDDGEKFGAWPTTWQHCWGDGALGRALLRGPRGQCRLDLDDHAVRVARRPSADRPGLHPDRLVRRDGRVGAAGRRGPGVLGRLAPRPGRTPAGGTLAARRVLAQLPGEVPRDQRPPQADAAGVGRRGDDARGAGPGAWPSTTSTRASRTTATGTACSVASTSATCGWRPGST